MPKLNLEQPAQVIGNQIDNKVASEQVQRGYMGLSQVGLVHECERKAWYMMRGQLGEKFPGRILRLFRTGDDTETNVVNDLISIGIPVTDSQKEVEATQGNMRLYGHIDGIVSGLENFNLGKKECLFECKSVNDKKFNELVKLQSYEKWNQVYKAQAHVYALLLGLDRILVVVENKNNSHRYFERIHLDEKYALRTLQIAFLLMEQDFPPERTCNNPAFYKARFCDFKEGCFAT